MTHSYQNGLLHFIYRGALEEARSTMLYNTLLHLHDELREKKTKGVFISIAHATHLNNTETLEHLIKILDKASQKLELTIGIGDYKKETFEALKALSAPTQIKLFQTLQAATLFMNAAFFKKEIHVLLFDEESEHADRLAAELLKLGYSTTHAKTLEEFKEKASSKNYDMTITQNRLNQHKSQLALQPALALSKELIVNLPIFIDTAVDSLVTITALEAQKITHKVRSFDAQIKGDVIIASMKFKGDLSGHFLLIFPKEVALLALDAMLGESVDPSDMAAIIDGVGEFCNIITGAAKVKFSTKQIKVLFELPKTYTSITLAINETLNANGLWIEMQLNQRPFYLFITK